MFLDKKYVFVNELIQHMGIKIDPVINLKKSLDRMNDGSTIIQIKKYSFINKKSYNLPERFRDVLVNEKWTDVSDKLPCYWVKEEYRLTEKELFNHNFIQSVVKICNKPFYHFTPEFVQKLKNKNGYTMSIKEAVECMEKKEIDGYIKLKYNKCFTWF